MARVSALSRLSSTIRMRMPVRGAGSASAPDLWRARPGAARRPAGDDELAPAAWPSALGLDRPAVQLDDPLD
jgi:hypothetical protein